MTDVNVKTLCPLPWLHLSAHLDTSLRICCNTDTTGFVKTDDGNNILLKDLSNLNEYFNLNFFKDIRAKMLKALRPKTCQKCYEIEDAGGHSVRQSYLDIYLDDTIFLDSLKKTRSDGTITPKVQSLDFSLSNKCNLKCLMCSPYASYSIKNDWKKLKLDYYDTFTQDAFHNWKDLPNLESLTKLLSAHLKHVLTTGGEPFLNQTHFKLVEYLVESGHAHKIELTYHTNCTVYNGKLFKLWKNFKKINLHFSLDAVGDLNGYIRHKSTWAIIEKNIHYFLHHPKTNCEVHTTIQAINIFNLPELYEWMRTKPNLGNLPFHIWIDHPPWLHIDILPTQLKKLALVRILQYFKTIPDKEKDYHFEAYEQQIVSYLKRSLTSPQDKKNLEQFKQLIPQFEKIRSQKPIQELVPEISTILSS
ncbi:MAG: twitch domain-containing radical SAM protein [Bacteriovoracaceae bacterium]|jgi:MoaA/NifB/PqqE/SkfB family radical SAM enzyme|nr:hypothetical protein [Halobacteriovoraceae bacterium]MDP7322018.1 twitch domain-containing radical SAM protein [Bacteriovoracaceae bacterium]